MIAIQNVAFCIIIPNSSRFALPSHSTQVSSRKLSANRPLWQRYHRLLLGNFYISYPLGRGHTPWGKWSAESCADCWRRKQRHSNRIEVYVKFIFFLLFLFLFKQLEQWFVIGRIGWRRTSGLPKTTDCANGSRLRGTDRGRKASRYNAGLYNKLYKCN